jgi:hypothetical protein
MVAFRHLAVLYLRRGFWRTEDGGQSTKEEDGEQLVF